MNKLTKITLALALFTSLVAKAEEQAVEPAQESAPIEQSLEHFAAIPDYQAQASVEPQADLEQGEAEESILDEAVSSQEAAPVEALPQS